MRIRATVAAVTGALALAAFAAPAAQAATTGTPYTMDVSFSGLKIASSTKIGANTTAVKIAYSYTMTYGSDVDITAPDFASDAYLYRGNIDDDVTLGYDKSDFATCTANTAAPGTATCKGTVDIYQSQGDLVNTDAGVWNVAAEAFAYNGQDPQTGDLSKVGFNEQAGMATTKILRNVAVTADAGPEPVKKGATLTTTGKLTCVNWVDHKYHALANQYVTLQFEKYGTTTWTNVKTVKSDAYGNLKGTATATYSGYWRYRWAGNSATALTYSAADYVAVQ